MAKLGQFVNIKTGKLDANASSESGQYPFFTCAIQPLKIDSYSYDCECVLVAGNGDLNVKYYKGKFDAYQRTYIIESRDKSILYVPYLYFFLDKYVETLRTLSIGGVIKYIKLGNLTDADIPVPDLRVQEDIVSTLKKATQTIDLCNAILEKLDLLVKARFVEMFGDVIQNPLNWTTLTLNDICVKITDGEHGSVERSEEGYPFLNAKHITKSGDIDWNTVTYVSEEIHKKIYARCNPCYDDILMTTTGTIGNLTIVPNCGEFSMDRGITLLKLNHDMVCSAFVYCYLQSNAIQDIMVSNVHASAIGHLFINQVMKIPMYLPPLDLQNQFAAFVEKTDRTKAAVKQVLAKAETLKKALMQEYFG